MIVCVIVSECDCECVCVLVLECLCPERLCRTSKGEEGVDDSLFKSVSQGQVGDADVLGSESITAFPRLLIHVRADSRYSGHAISVG